MKNKALKYYLVCSCWLIANITLAQQETDTIAFESSLLETSKGATKQEVGELKQKVKKIKIVSYRGMSSLIYSDPYVSDLPGFENEKILSGGKKNKVLDLLYSDKAGVFQALCYHPRNAVILYNSANEEIGYIEICFECITMKSESNIPELPQLSEEGYAELKAVFRKYGLIKYEDSK